MSTPTPPLPPHRGLTVTDRRRVQVVAWTVLLASFAVFVVAALGLPWLGLRYLRTATVEEKALAESKVGSVTLESVPGVVVLRQGDAPQAIYEGTTVTTDGAAKAFIRFFDGSTLNLDPNSRVTVRHVRRPRFSAGQVPRRIEVLVEAQPGAQARLTAGTTWGDLVFEMVVPELGLVRVAPESRARLELDTESLNVRTFDGQVTVVNAGGTVTARSDQRAEVMAGQAPLGPLPALEDLLENGDFDAPPLEANGWTLVRNPPPGGPVPVTNPPQSEHRVSLDERSMITFVRQESGGNPADIYYRQVIEDVDVTANSFIGVSATLRVLGQSLPGGGRGSPPSEFPVILKLVFESASGEDLWWSIGFFAKPPAADDPSRSYLSQKHVAVPLGEWFEFGSGNLLDDGNPYGFAQRERPLPRPVRLRRFEVVASGHDYESQVDRVGVWVK